MLRIKLKTDEVSWALAFAGAVLSAQNYVKLGANAPFEFYLETNNPILNELAQAWVKTKDKEYQEIALPVDDEELVNLDHLIADNINLEMIEGHGMMIDQKVQVSTSGYERIASFILKSTYNLFNEPSYWFPTRSPNNKFTADVLITSEKYRELAEAWYEGLEGTKANKIININSKEYKQDALNYIYSKPKGIVCRVDDPVCLIGRALYTDFDDLKNNTPHLTYVSENWAGINLRCVNPWAACIPFSDGDGVDSIFEKGKIWAVRRKYNFNHHLYSKALALGVEPK